MQRGDIDIKVDDEPVAVRGHAVELEPHHAVEPLDEPLQLPAATEAASVAVPTESHSQPISNQPSERNPLRSTRTDWKTRFNILIFQYVMLWYNIQLRVISPLMVNSNKS